MAPRAAAEELGYTFLPCVLVGLSRAPQFVTNRNDEYNLIWADQIDALVVPATACGGSATMSFSNSAATIITVTENTTQIEVPPEPLGMKTIRVHSYLEALGVA